MEMKLEWVIVALLLAVALVPLGRRVRSPRVWAVLTLCYGFALGAAALWQGRLDGKEKRRAAIAAKTPHPRETGGYARSDNCKACHPEQYDSWHRSYHRTMTQLPSTQTVRGEFDNVTLEYAGEKYHLERRGEEFWADMVDPDWKYVQSLKRASRQPTHPEEAANPPRVKKQITMLTGSHHMQAYWVASGYGNRQFSFPFTYLFHDKRWAPRNDVFLLDPAIPWIQQVWNVNCINCHATAGQPRQDPTTKIIDSRTVELGISCESCHGPGEEHVRLNSDPQRRYAMHYAARGDPSIFNPGRHEHLKASETCSQCHAIRRNIHKEEWNMEGVHYWPGEEIQSKAPLIHYDGADLDAPGNEQKRALMEGSFWKDGQVRVSGRDFSAMATSGCFTRGQISCLSCHSMHQYQSTAHQLKRNMEGNQACFQCHGEYEAGLEAHTRHRAGSSGSLCYNCHMPHTTYGLLKAIRSHTINSPSVKSSLDTGRPNACNLCHLDKSLGWTATKLNQWHQQPLPVMTEEQTDTSAAMLWLLKGDAGQRSLIAWHMGWEPAKITSGQTWMPRFLAESLVDSYSSVRYIAQRSLKALPGYEDLPYDYIGPVEHRNQSRQKVLETWRNKPVVMEGGSVFQPSDVLLEDERIKSLLQQRDNRRIELLE